MRRIIVLLLIVFGSFPLVFGEEKDNPEFRYGKLHNGLTYYIRHTHNSSGRADFYLVQNVGALMEEENQNGLAHVLEHMAFHATDNFPEGVPVFLKRQSISAFNAYTGHDETVYNINNVPTASKALVDSCILILRDWSGFLKLYPKDMDTERGVIQEERRSGMDLSARMQAKANFYIYNGSKYATHDVIGTVEVLQNFTPEELKNYYHDFYRPDQQAVIILGDIDVAAVEAEVKRLFNSIPKRENPKPREVYPIPDNAEPLYCKLIDKDIPSKGMTLMKRFKKNPIYTLEDMLRDDLIRDFYNKVMKEFLNDFIKSDAAHFLSAGIGIFPIVRGYEGLNMIVSSLPGGELEAVEQVTELMARVHEQVITQQKIEQLVANYLVGLEKIELQKDNLPNRFFLQMYQNNFLLKYPISEIDENIKMTKEVLAKLTVQDFQNWISRWYDNDENWIFVMQGNDENYPYPTEEEIMAAIKRARTLTFTDEGEKQSEDSSGWELLDFEIKGGQIVKTKLLKPLEAEEWILNNGAKVYYKYTQDSKGVFNVLLGSRGGRSLLPAGDLPSADAMVAMFLKNGLYKYDARALETVIKEQSINLSMSFDEDSESMNCMGMKRDAELAFQFIYLVFEHPRFDKAAFDKYVYISKATAAHTVQTANDTITKAMREIKMIDSPRLWQADTNYYAAMDYDKMVAIYKDRFQDASDFKFYVVGDIDRDQARDLVAKYIGAVPSIYRKEEPVQHEYYKKGSVTKEIEANIPEQQYMVNIEYQNTLKTKPIDRLYMSILQLHFDHLFQKKIREDEGGSYSVQILANTSDYPKYTQYFAVQFASSLEKGPRMRQIAHEEIKKFLMNGISDEEVEDFILLMKKDRTERLGEDSIPFWTENIQFYIRTGKTLDSPEFFDKIVNKVNAKGVLAFARKFFESAECSDIVVKSKE